MKFRPLTTLVLILAMASPAAAYADYTVKGSVECPNVVKEDANEHFREYNKWWILGYFSGRNYERDRHQPDSTVGKDFDSDDLYARVLHFCRDNPRKDMDDASLDLYDLLQ